MCERERHTHRQRDKDSDRDTQRDRHTERQTDRDRQRDRERWQYLEKRSKIAQMTEFSVVMASTSIHKLGTCTLFGVASYKLENKMSFSLYASMGAGHI